MKISVLVGVLIALSPMSLWAWPSVGSLNNSGKMPVADMKRGHFLNNTAVCESLTSGSLGEPGKTAYQKVKGILPDLFCCADSDQTTEERLACLTTNLEKTYQLRAFVQSDIYIPLNQAMEDVDNFIPGGGGSWGGDPIEDKLSTIRGELHTIGAILKAYAGYMTALQNKNGF